MAFFFALEYFLFDLVFQNFPEVSPLSAYFWNFVGAIFSGAFFFGQKKFRKNVRKLLRKKWFLILMLAAIASVSSFLFVFVIDKSNSGITSLLNRADVIFSAIFGFFFLAEKLKKLEIFGLLIALFGVGFIVNLRGEISFSVAILALFAGSLTALHSFLAKQFLGDSDALATAFLRAIFVVILTAPVLFFVEKSLFPPSFFPFFLLFISGVFGSFISRIFYFRAIEIIAIGKVHTIALLEPIFVLFGSIFFLGAAANAQKLFGAIFILSGLFFATRAHFQDLKKSKISK